MIDDPLSLLSLGIWLMAAGMYPLGFMFGVCSACCDEDECPDECDKCTHFYNQGATDQGCGNINELGTLNWSIEGVGATSGFESEIEIAQPDLPAEALPEGQEWINATINIGDSIGGTQILGRCECAICNHDVGFIARFNIDPSDRLAFNGGCLGTLAKCDETQIAFACAGITWTLFDPANPSPEQQPVIDAVLEYLNTLSISASFDDIPPCDCGACCETEDEVTTCDEDVAEGFCVDSFPTIQRQWQGVGIGCDPNPCPQPVLGACCDEQGQCSVTTEPQCDENNGIWYEGVTCDPSPCVGACCDQWEPGGCTEGLTQEECDGYFWQFNSGCEGVCDPPLGSCCDNGDCTETTEDECGGTWTEGQRCDPDPC